MRLVFSVGDVLHPIKAHGAYYKVLFCFQETKYLTNFSLPQFAFLLLEELKGDGANPHQLSSQGETCSLTPGTS